MSVVRPCRRDPVGILLVDRPEFNRRRFEYSEWYYHIVIIIIIITTFTGKHDALRVSTISLAIISFARHLFDYVSSKTTKINFRGACIYVNVWRLIGVNRKFNLISRIKSG